MKALLFVDLLGARLKWMTGGAPASKAAFDRFNKLMVSAARPDGDSIIEGGIETDAAAFVCSDAASALRIADRAFNWAFNQGNHHKADRVWLRGSVVPYPTDEPLRRPSPVSALPEQLNVHVYSESFFDAVSVEKSGYKGMRLLVRDSLVTDDLIEEVKVPVLDLWFSPLSNLRYSPYPKMADSGLVDYLWMISPDEEEWKTRGNIMATRLRYSAASSPQEFLQAAATQVLFSECGSMYKAMLMRSIRENGEGKPVESGALVKPDDLEIEEPELPDQPLSG